VLLIMIKESPLKRERAADCHLIPAGRY